jgi:hypothetical protein
MTMLILMLDLNYVELDSSGSNRGVTGGISVPYLYMKVTILAANAGIPSPSFPNMGSFITAVFRRYDGVRYSALHVTILQHVSRQR